MEQVLLIRRGKEPQKGILTFPGGSLELGETMADCATRETLEETGLQLRNRAQGELYGPFHVSGDLMRWEIARKGVSRWPEVEAVSVYIASGSLSVEQPIVDELRVHKLQYNQVQCRRSELALLREPQASRCSGLHTPRCQRGHPVSLHHRRCKGPFQPPERMLAKY